MAIDESSDATAFSLVPLDALLSAHFMAFVGCNAIEVLFVLTGFAHGHCSHHSRSLGNR